MRIERELKVMADHGKEPPDLSDAVQGLSAGDTVHVDLTAVYYDTPELSLISSGVTLRCRSGEPGPMWTLKLPSGGDDGTLERHEIHFDGGTGVVPAGALDAVTAYVRRSALSAVAEIRTKRAATDLRLGDVVVATICDDHVEGRYGDAITQFREIEVELIGAIAGVDLLKAVRARFRGAGWKIEVTPLPKLSRVLGDAVTGHPVVRVPEIGRKATMNTVVHAAIAQSVRALVSYDAGTRLDLDVEELHQFRVAGRRLRSDLGTFRGGLDRSWVRDLRTDLRWLGGIVGTVRDLDVLSQRFADTERLLDSNDAGAATLLIASLHDQRAAARDEMLVALRSPRYLDLLEKLIEAAHGPHVAHPARDADSPDERAEELLALRVLPGRVRKTWKQLKSAAEDLQPDSPDEDLHEVRILAKHCRYAAEAAVPVSGRPARRFAAAIKELQGLLGDVQDTVVAEAWLRDTARSTPALGVVAGLLVAAEREKRATLRGSVTDVWRKASSASLRPWMK